MSDNGFRRLRQAVPPFQPVWASLPADKAIIAAGARALRRYAKRVASLARVGGDPG
ncbi:MAG TPA: hypothetical protein VGK74_27900 [Symbiobacteriaceae bacterium]|jgi:hypothetical protein